MKAWQRWKLEVFRGQIGFLEECEGYKVVEEDAKWPFMDYIAIVFDEEDANAIINAHNKEGDEDA